MGRENSRGGYEDGGRRVLTPNDDDDDDDIGGGSTGYTMGKIAGDMCHMTVGTTFDSIDADER